MNPTEHEALLIRGGRVIDPAVHRDEIADVAIVDGIIAERAPTGAPTIDAAGLIVCPGLLDIHVHLREPGQTHKETIATGAAAATAGGFTFVACMPNTNPPLDTPEQIRFVRERSLAANLCDVGPIGCITVGRQGEIVTDFAALKEAGAIAFSDDGTGVEDDAIMRQAFELARDTDSVLIQHCEYRAISDGGCMHLGEVSRRLGLPGLDPRSEEAMIERDIALCKETSGRYHVAHISTAKAIELVRVAKADGVAVTAEVCPHHLLLTDEACADMDPATKVHPPLRSASDVEACRQGLLDGTIDCVATDHAPHTKAEKSVGFQHAPPGLVGLETAVGLVAKAMISPGLADWPQLIAWLTTEPARILGLPAPTIAFGAPANLTLIDPNKEWTIDPAKFASMSRNTPFRGWELTGRPLGTIRGRRASIALGT